MLMTILGVVLAIASLCCSIFILVEMFRDAVWKGVVGLLCFPYAWYYALFELDHEWKWPIALTYILGGGSALGIFGS